MWVRVYLWKFQRMSPGAGQIKVSNKLERCESLVNQRKAGIGFIPATLSSPVAVWELDVIMPMQKSGRRQAAGRNQRATMGEGRGRFEIQQELWVDSPGPWS